MQRCSKTSGPRADEAPSKTRNPPLRTSPTGTDRTAITAGRRAARRERGSGPQPPVRPLSGRHTQITDAAPRDSASAGPDQRSPGSAAPRDIFSAPSGEILPATGKCAGSPRSVPPRPRALTTIPGTFLSRRGTPESPARSQGFHRARRKGRTPENRKGPGHSAEGSAPPQPAPVHGRTRDRPPLPPGTRREEDERAHGQQNKRDAFPPRRAAGAGRKCAAPRKPPAPKEEKSNIQVPSGMRHGYALR